MHSNFKAHRHVNCRPNETYYFGKLILTLISISNLLSYIATTNFPGAKIEFRNNIKKQLNLPLARWAKNGGGRPPKGGPLGPSCSQPGRGKSPPSKRAPKAIAKGFGFLQPVSLQIRKQVHTYIHPKTISDKKTASMPGYLPEKLVSQKIAYTFKVRLCDNWQCLFLISMYLHKNFR